MGRLDDLLLLLNILKTDNQISDFLFKYLDDSEIVYLLNIAEQNAYILRMEKKFHLTDKGKIFIKERNKEMSRKGIEQFIVPLSKYRIDKMNFKDVYLP